LNAIVIGHGTGDPIQLHSVYRLDPMMSVILLGTSEQCEASARCGSLLHRQRRRMRGGGSQ
jgi:hypothetical protein